MPKRQKQPAHHETADLGNDHDNDQTFIDQTPTPPNQAEVVTKPTTELEPISQTVEVESAEVSPSPRFNKKLWWIPGLLVCLVLILGYWVYRSQAVSSPDRDGTLLQQIGNLVDYSNEPLLGEADDRINVLLLGIGGAGHDGGTLTDTMMVASIKPSTKQVALLSLPRDLIVKIYNSDDKNDWSGHKINSAYVYGGIPMALDKVSEVTGLKLHYYVLLDFDGFRQVIDDVDGVDVTVEHNFEGLYGAKELSTPCPQKDLYQLDDGAYCGIRFKKGEQHFDGEQALIYARIRKLAPNSGNAEEGSDFARAHRQQQILESFKAKLLSANTFIRPTRVSNILADIDAHLDTNLKISEVGRLLSLVGDVSSDQIIHQVVDNSVGGLVTTKIYEPTGASVVVPVAGDYNYSEIRQVAKKIFHMKPEAEVEADTAIDPTAATIQILNGTSTVGLAAQTAAVLQNQGFTSVTVANAPTNDYLETRIYDFTDGDQSATIELLQATVGGTVATTPERDTLVSLDPNGIHFDTEADFIIILGSDVVTKNN